MSTEREDHNLQQELATIREKWLAMPTEGEAGVEAARYYREKLFPLACSLFMEKERGKMAARNLYGLIMTVGKSPEPLILTLSACRPQKILFLYTVDTEKQLDEIIDYVRLSPSQWDKRLVKKADLRTIYQAVKEVWEQWGRKSEIAVDITGGTKSMAAGLALVGAFLDFELLYVDSTEFLPERRRPEPGTEYLKLLPNPYEVFGVLKEKNALELLERQEFYGASQILSELVQNVPDPRRAQSLQALALAYGAWDGLNLKMAAHQLGQAIEIKKKLNLGEVTEEIIFLQEQREKVGYLAELMPTGPQKSTLELLEDKEAVETLVFTLYHNAQRRAHQGKWDSASLFLYRLLEIMEQRRLASYGIDTAQPDYSSLTDDLLTVFNGVRRGAKMDPVQRLPDPIALTDGYMLLEALEDPLRLSVIPTNKGKGIGWIDFGNQIRNRNYSILAHGFIFVSQRQYQRFKGMVDGILSLFCTIEGIERKKEGQYTFLIPGEIW